MTVCGTGTRLLARGFSWQFRRNPLDLAVAASDHRLSVIGSWDFPQAPPYRLGRLTPLGLPLCVPPSLITLPRGTGILTSCPSPTPRGLGLGPTHPQLINMAAEPFGLRWGGFAPPSRYLYRHSHLSSLQPCSRSTFTADDNAPLPRSQQTTSAASVLVLSPGTLSAPEHVRPVSYYALFQGWLLLSQPPGCLCAPTSLPT